MDARDLHNIILDAYTHESLRRMLKYRLDKNLEEIAGGKNLEEIVYNVIAESKRSGWISELIESIREDKPNNPQVRNMGRSSRDSMSIRRDEYERLEEDLAYLKNIVLGVRGMDNGIVDRLKIIDRKVDQLRMIIAGLVILDIGFRFVFMFLR
jgi:hypothetical protein